MGHCELQKAIIVLNEERNINLIQVNKKTILITGAGTGIGKDTAFALAKQGHYVIATTETQEQSEALKQEAKTYGAQMEIFKLDLLNETDRNKIENFDLDILLNNAGVGESGPLAEIDMDRVRYNFEVNVFCALALSQLALKRMLKKGRGRVIFMSSLASKISTPFLAPYCMSKAALSSAAQALRSEMRRVNKEIDVCVIEPGAYHTGFNQKNIAKKYGWIREDSFFYGILEQLKPKEEREFRIIEMKSTRTIVRKIVKAVEAQNPHARYSAPWWQAFGVYLLRLFGK